MKAAHGEIKAKVLALCDKPEGASLKEIRIEIDRQSRTAMSTANRLLESGELHRSGVKYFTRYFARQEHADAFAVIAAAEYEKHKALKYEERKAQWRENKRNKPKVKKLRKQAVRQTIKQTKPYTPPTPVQAKVIWPEHVHVQRIPAKRDTRFTFDPPPGWRGEITRDWMNHRLQSVSGAA